MIVLDTNVVSELMRQVPNDEVVRWVDRYPADEVFITAVTAADAPNRAQRRSYASDALVTGAALPIRRRTSAWTQRWPLGAAHLRRSS